MKYGWSKIMILGFLGLWVISSANLLRAEEGAGEDMGSGMHWKKDHEGLKLTDDQKSKLKALWESGEKTMKPLMRKGRDLSFKLRDQVDDKASDSDIKATLASIQANRNAMREQFEKQRAEKAAILTPTQQAQMMLRHMRHHPRWGHKEGDREGMGEGGQGHEPHDGVQDNEGTHGQ